MNTSTKFKEYKMYNYLYIFIFISLLCISFPKIFSQTWYPLGSGTNGSVLTSIVFNGDLIIAGDFTIAGGITSNRIAKWNGTNWNTMNSGFDNTVYSLANFNGELFAAGKFLNSGNVSCNRIAVWNGSSWQPLGLGTNDIVYSLSVYSGNLRVGGAFTNAGGVNANRVARWDGSIWTAMGLGMNDEVHCMTLFGSDLIIGGKFTTASGIPEKRICSYNVNGLYLPLGSGFDSGTVYDVYVYDNNLIAGGDFTSIGGIPVYYIAKWNGSNWFTLGTGMNSSVYSLGEWNGELIVGGKFTSAGGISANYIAGWNGTSWSSLGTGMSGGSTTINTLASWSNILIAGGNFNQAGGVNASNIAAYGGLPSPPNLISPCNSQGDSLTPLLDWSDVFEATSYGVQVSNDPNFTNILINVNSLPISQYQISSGILQQNTTYFWRANASNGLGTSAWSMICYFTTLITGIINHNDIPLQFKLYQNYPNPFNPNTKIKFDLPINNSYPTVQLNIFDVNGKEVYEVHMVNYKPGSHEVDVFGKNFASGIYFYQLIAGDFIQSKKMIIIK